MKRSQSQSGFSAVEVVLVVALVAMIGVAGYFAYKANKNSESSTAATSSTKQGEASPQTASDLPAKADEPGLKIPQLGIRILSLPPSLGTVTFTVNSDNSGALFSTDALTKLDSRCDAASGADGSLSIKSGQEDNRDHATDEAVKQFPTFWVAYGHPQSTCSDNQQAQDLQISQMKELQTVLTNPDNIQLISN